jgi:hypothetical protein
MLLTLPVPAQRLTGATASSYGTALATALCSATATQGFYASPFQLPDQIHPSRPLSVWADLWAPAGNATPNLAIRLQLQAVAWSQNAAPTNLATITLDWPVPNPLLNTDRKQILFETTPGSGNTYPGNTLARGQLLGLLITRVGGAIADNYPGTIHLACNLTLGYYPRCQALLCA